MAGSSTPRDPRHAPLQARAAVDRGLDIVTTVRDSAAEVVRKRRDPSYIAERRRVAARRRLVVWSIAGLVLLGVGATGITEIAHGEGSAGSIGGLVLVAGLWVYCVIGSVQAARDLRARSKAARRLPPPGPHRRAVTTRIRPLIARLDGYSDALRHSVGLIGVGTVGSKGRVTVDESMESLRNQTLASADEAEIRLRNKAAEYSALTRGGGTALAPDLAPVASRLEQEIRDGVDEYGRLVAAASDAAGASQGLAGQSLLRSDDMTELTDRLSALAAGMREITDRPDGDFRA